MNHVAAGGSLERHPDGFYRAICMCKWFAGPFPDVEVAVDALMEHAAAMTTAVIGELEVEIMDENLRLQAFVQLVRDLVHNAKTGMPPMVDRPMVDVFVLDEALAALNPTPTQGGNDE